MLSRNKELERKLEELVLKEQKEESEREYAWTENLDCINFWNFLSVNYLDLDRLFTLLDIEDGPKSGWEKFVEVLGLKLWEDRKWCVQYHNGTGPTRAALSKLLEKNDCDRDLSLGNVMELIKEMERFDILLQIDWKNLIEKYNNLPNKDQRSIMENEKLKEPLMLQLNCNFEPCQQQLVKADNLGETEELNTNAGISVESKKNTKNVKKKLPCILMTYAKDAEVDAIKIANQLRDRQKRNFFRVLLLGDPNVKKALVNDRSNTLHKWFHQVRYVVPVVSPEYLRQIQNLTTFRDDFEEALNNRLIYKMTLDQYVSFGARNLRCRPACPEKYYPDIRHHRVVEANGLFSVMWTSREDKVEELRLVLMDKPLLQ